MTRRLAAALCLLLGAALARGEEVVCHVSYGGQTQRLVATPTSSPYTVAPTAFESWFLFRIVFRRTPADLAGIRLTAYGRDAAGSPQTIHQASYPYPPPAAAGDGGFTGRQAVYEPRLNAELQYWCELRDADPR